MKRPVASLLRALPLPGGTKVQIADVLGRRIESNSTSQAVIRMRDGFRMSLNLAAVVERKMFYSGIYEPWLTFAFKRIIQHHERVQRRHAPNACCRLNYAGRFCKVKAMKE